MKKLILLASLVSASVFGPTAIASEGGSCHFHGSKPASESVVVGCAMDRKQALVKQGKLDASWANVKQDEVRVVEGKKGKEWLLTFKNPAATDASKQTLYMFYSLPGNFIAANYTGK